MKIAPRTYTLGGRTQLLSAWARELGVKWNTLNWRVTHGWSFERAIATPIRRYVPLSVDSSFLSPVRGL